MAKKAQNKKAHSTFAIRDAKKARDGYICPDGRRLIDAKGAADKAAGDAVILMSKEEYKASTEVEARKDANEAFSEYADKFGHVTAMANALMRMAKAEKGARAEAEAALLGIYSRFSFRCGQDFVSDDCTMIAAAISAATVDDKGVKTSRTKDGNSTKMTDYGITYKKNVDSVTARTVRARLMELFTRGIVRDVDGRYTWPIWMIGEDARYYAAEARAMLAAGRYTEAEDQAVKAQATAQECSDQAAAAEAEAAAKAAVLQDAQEAMNIASDAAVRVCETKKAAEEAAKKAKDAKQAAEDAEKAAKAFSRAEVAYLAANEKAEEAAKDAKAARAKANKAAEKAAKDAEKAEALAKAAEDAEDAEKVKAANAAAKAAKDAKKAAEAAEKAAIFAEKAAEEAKDRAVSAHGVLEHAAAKGGRTQAETLAKAAEKAEQAAEQAAEAAEKAAEDAEQAEAEYKSRRPQVDNAEALAKKAAGWTKAAKQAAEAAEDAKVTAQAARNALKAADQAAAAAADQAAAEKATA